MEPQFLLHERKKNIARMQLEVSIQTQVALFESDWEAQWVRKVTGMSLSAMYRMRGEKDLPEPEGEQGPNLLED